MARIPYPALDQADLAPLIARIRAERGGRLPNLYRLLLHSPPLADGWRALLTAVRQQATLPGRLRELAILEIAVLNGAEYEFNAHIPFARAENITEGQLQALRAGRHEPFDVRDRAVLDYTAAMTRGVQVPEQIFAAVRTHLNDRELVELTVTVGAYNLVSRFLVALEVDHE